MDREQLIKAALYDIANSALLLGRAGIRATSTQHCMSKIVGAYEESVS